MDFSWFDLDILDHPHRQWDANGSPRMERKDMDKEGRSERRYAMPLSTPGAFTNIPALPPVDG